MEGWDGDATPIDSQRIIQGVSQSENPNDVYDEPDGFRCIGSLKYLDSLIDPDGVVEVDQAFHAEVIVDPSLFINDKMGRTIMPDTKLRPECIRCHMDGKVYIYFSFLDLADELSEGWLYGLHITDLHDAMPDFAAGLEKVYKTGTKETFKKLDAYNRVAVGQRRRITEKMNEILSDAYERRLSNLEMRREQAVKAHYTKAEDTGIF